MSNIKVFDLDSPSFIIEVSDVDNIVGGLFGTAAGAFVAGEIARRDGKPPRRERGDALIGAIGGFVAGLPGGPLGAALSTPKMI